MSRFSMDWSELSLQVMITFAHFLWQACVVGLVLFVAQHVAESLRDSGILQLCRVSKKRVSLGETDLRETDLRGANIHYMIACMAFFSLPIFVIATFAWVHQSRGPIVLVAGDTVEVSSSPIDSANKTIPTMANTDIPTLIPSASPMVAEMEATKPIEASTLMVKPHTSPVHRIQAFASYLLLAYIVGVGFMLARFLLSIIGSSRLRRTIQPITDVKLLKTIAEQCARVGLKRIPVVALCQRVSVPVVVGIVKPMILLPPTLLCGLDPNQVAAILSHELAHIRRYDLIVNFLQRIVEALLFFHPVTWWISRRISIERENCCDDIAAAGMGRLTYAGALLQMAELCIGKERPRAAALATLSATGENSTDLGYRIRRLIDAQATPQIRFTKRSFAFGLATLALMGASFISLAQSPQTQRDESQSQPSKDSVVELSFDNLKFDIEKGGDFKRSMLTKEIESLDKATIRIRGYILPQSVFKSRGFDEFVLVRDNQECCFGPGAALNDCIVVRMEKDKTTDFVTRPVDVVGKFEIKEFKYPDSEKHYAVFQLTATEVKHVPVTALKPTKDGPAVEPADNLLEGNRNAAQNLDHVAKTGTLQGKITLDEKIPKRLKLRVQTPTTPRLPKRAPKTDEEKKKYMALRAEIEASLVEIDNESFQIDADGGLANVFVYLANAPADWQPTKADLQPITLTMQDYRFEPRAAIIRVGQDMRLINSGVAADNFHFEPRNNGAQNRLVKEGTEFTFERPFTSPEKTPIQAKSDTNVWKMTYLLPLDHPFAAVTDKQGRFSIDGLPPGTHTFQIWHERTGWLEKSLNVNIQAGQTTEVNRPYGLEILALETQKARLSELRKYHEDQREALIVQRDKLEKERQSLQRKDLVGRMERAIAQRDKASKDSSDYPRLNHWVQIQELHLAQFDLENGIAGIDLPDAPEATPERIAELRELLRFRWGLPVDGIQLGIARTDDRFRYTAGEKIPFQVFIRNITQEPITQSLSWGDAKNLTTLLRSDTNIYLSPRPNSLPVQSTELRLEPGAKMELPRGQFEMDTAGLHPGIYHIDGNFPVVFANRAGESSTRVARPIDSDAMPRNLFFRFELVGEQSPPQNKPADKLKEVAEYADVQWGKTVYGLQAGARYRNNDKPANEVNANNSETKAEPPQRPVHIGDTIKTEVLVRNVSDQPVTVRFHPSAGSEVQMLSAMQSNLTEVSSRGIMRRSDVPIAHDSDRTVERTLQPGEVFVAAHQDFEIQLLLDGRERQLDLPKANRHWVKGSGDYTYTAYLKLNITDSLSVSLNSGRIKMPISSPK